MAFVDEALFLGFTDTCLRCLDATALGRAGGGDVFHCKEFDTIVRPVVPNCPLEEVRQVWVPEDCIKPDEIFPVERLIDIQRISPRAAMNDDGVDHRHFR